MKADFDELTRDWSRKTASELRRAARKFKKGKTTPFRDKVVHIKSRGIAFEAREIKLKDSISAKTDSRRGRVQFQIAYHSKFVEIGAGRGRRTPRPVFSAILTPAVDKLADAAVAAEADVVVKTILPND